MSTQTVYLSHQKKKRVVLLSNDEAKNDHSALQAMEDEIASFKRFDCYGEVCRLDHFSRSSYVDDNSCFLVSSLPSLLYTMSSHRDIYI
jgi:hypothetical protein